MPANQSKKTDNSNFIKGRVSIVTPVYNGEKFVGRLLDSVLNQTYEQIEMILADDGSCDLTLKIAEDYRVQFARRDIPYRIVSAPHRNAAAAINAGLPYVTGEFLIWPDSDDELMPNSIKRRVDYLTGHPYCPCVRSLSCYIDDATGTSCDRREKNGDTKEENLFFPILFSQTFVCCGCYMLRSALFFRIYPNRVIPEYSVGQNFQMLLPYMYHYRCHTIEEELYVVHIREDSHSMTALTREQEEKKYADFEVLIDDISEILNISSRSEKRKIKYWKLRRRYDLARRYKDRKKALSVWLQLILCGGIELKTTIRRITELIKRIVRQGDYHE